MLLTFYNFSLEPSIMLIEYNTTKPKLRNNCMDFGLDIYFTLIRKKLGKIN
jgi:hypothetical protein